MSSYSWPPHRVTRPAIEEGTVRGSPMRVTTATTNSSRISSAAGPISFRSFPATSSPRSAARASTNPPTVFFRDRSCLAME